MEIAIVRKLLFKLVSSKRRKKEPTSFSSLSGQLDISRVSAAFASSDNRNCEFLGLSLTEAANQ